MPSEPSDGIFDAPAVYRRGAGLEIPEPSFPTIPQSRNSSFPRRRESRSVSAGTYRAKRFLEILSPGFPLSRE
ncbi:pilus assembly protein PilS [Neisseria gonorrhoeae]